MKSKYFNRIIVYWMMISAQKYDDGDALGLSLEDDDGITDGHGEGIVVGDAVGSTDGDASQMNLKKE